MSVIKLAPETFIHILDRNSNVTTLEVGPQTYTCFDHQKLVFGPEEMIIIPPHHYCVINDPVQRDSNGTPIKDEHNRVLLKHKQQEIRFAPENGEPFPLYPGEKLNGKIERLPLVLAGTALLLEALKDHYTSEVAPIAQTLDGESGRETKLEEAKSKVFRRAGDRWLFEGPGEYIPSIEATIVKKIAQYVVNPGQALLIEATRDCIDRSSHEKRVTGESWLMKEAGAYMPGPYEEVKELKDSLVITEKTALHLRALQTLTDIFGNERQLGDEWLVTHNQCKTYLVGAHEKLICEEQIITLNSRESAVIQDYYDEETNSFQFGKKKLIRGPRNFFVVPPFERLTDKLHVVVLDATQAIKLKATESFYDEALKVQRNPGDIWYHYGPGEYWPVLEAERICICPIFISIGPIKTVSPLPLLLAILFAIAAIIYYFFAK